MPGTEFVKQTRQPINLSSLATIRRDCYLWLLMNIFRKHIASALLIALAALPLQACASKPQKNESGEPAIATGLEILAGQDFSLLAGKRVAW